MGGGDLLCGSGSGHIWTVFEAFPPLHRTVTSHHRAIVSFLVSHRDLTVYTVCLQRGLWVVGLAVSVIVVSVSAINFT